MRSFTNFNRCLVKRYDEWMIAMHYAKSTQRIYRQTIQRYVRFVGKRSIANASHKDIRHYIARISEDGATLSAVYRDLGVLRLFYDFLHLGGVVSYVAPRFVRLRRPLRESVRPLSESQVRRMISATRTPRERALIEFFYGTGCRLSEVINLRIENVDLNARTALIRGKLGKVRTVFLTATAANSVLAYIAGRRNGIVFRQDYPVQKGCLTAQDGKWKSKWGIPGEPGGKRVQKTKCLGRLDRLTYEDAKKKHDELISSLKFPRPKTDRPLSKVAVQQTIRHIAHRAGLNNVTPHTFRRTFATHLYDHGAGVEVIKVLMGHVWIQTTMTYAQIGPDRLARTFERCHPREKLNGPSSE
ncbi:MAG: tyrosine-type recombinase/integrase [Candidatus Acidiferrales bacterium]